MKNKGRNFYIKGASYAFSSLTPIFSGIVITPITTRLLGTFEYGVLAVSLVVVSLSLVFLTFGLPAAITRLDHHVEEQILQISGAANFQLIASMFVGFLGLLFQLTQPNLLNFPIGLAVFIGAIGSCISIIQAQSVGRNKSLNYAFFAIGTGVVAPVFGILSLIFFGKTALTYLVGLGFAYSVILGFEKVLGLFRTRSNFSFYQIRKSLSVGLPTLPHQLSVGATVSFAVLASQISLGAVGAAEVQISLLLASGLLIVISALTYSWVPTLKTMNQSEQGLFLSETAKRLMQLAAISALLITLVSKWLLMFLAPASSFDIQTMSFVIGLLSPIPVIAVIFLANVQILFLEGRTVSLTWIGPLAVALGFFASLYLSTWFGIIGIGVGFLFTYFLFGLLTAIAIKTISSVKWTVRPSTLWSVLLPVLVAIIFATASLFDFKFESEFRIVFSVFSIGCLAVLARKMLKPSILTPHESEGNLD